MVLQAPPPASGLKAEGHVRPTQEGRKSGTSDMTSDLHLSPHTVCKHRNNTRPASFRVVRQERAANGCCCKLCVCDQVCDTECQRRLRIFGQETLQHDRTPHLVPMIKRHPSSRSQTAETEKTPHPRYRLTFTKRSCFLEAETNQR